MAFLSARAILVGLPVLVSCGNVTTDGETNAGRAPLCVGPHWEELRVDSTSMRIEATHVRAGDGSVIVWGGIGWTGEWSEEGSHFRTDGWRFFPETGELRPMEGGPALAEADGAAFDDEVLFAGGYATADSLASDISRYSLASETWSTLPAPETGLRAVGATSDMWLLVNSVGEKVRYSAITGVWSTLTEMQFPQPDPWGSHVTVVGNELWTWRDVSEDGNWDYLSEMEALWRYDVATDHWTADKALGETKDSPTIVWLSALNRVAVFGGLLEDLDEPSNTGWLMDPTTGERTAMSAAPPVSARTANRTVIDGKRIFLFNEGAPDTPVGAIYDGVTDTWTTLDTECAPEYAESSIAIGGGRVLVWSNDWSASNRETAYVYTP